jgi:aminoglycoside 3-N-acetyltransferase
MWTRERIREDLEELAHLQGATVLIHASLRAVGKVEGSADAVLDALLEAVGAEGTVMVPLFNAANRAPDDWRERLPVSEVPFEAAAVDVPRMGALAAALAARPAAVRSSHPSLSFAAIGRNAAFLTENAPFQYPLGGNSPLARLHQLNGSVLLLGTDHTVNSVLHLAEAWADAPYARRSASVRVSESEWREMHGSPECSAGFRKIERILRQARIARTGYVGNALTQVMRCQYVVSMAMEMLKGSPEALLCDDLGCSSCTHARKLAAEQFPLSPRAG